MLIISISVRNATAFSKKRHTLRTRARERTRIHTHTPTPAVNRNCTPTITTFLHLTQLHVSRIIRQRLDNPDRNPFSFPQPPCKFSFCNIVFSQYPDNQRPFKDLKIPSLWGSHLNYYYFFFFLLSRNLVLHVPDLVTMKSDRKYVRTWRTRVML